MEKKKDSFVIEPTDVAIIGMSGVFPGAEDLKQFWQNLLGNEESITRFEESEALFSKKFVNAKPIITGTECFDAPFFNISARDAAMMDPQHRMLLQSSWHCFEDAGYIPEKAGGSVGVFLASNFNTYQHLEGWMSHLWGDLNGDFSKRFSAYSGNIVDTIATRVSYKFGLTGPSFTVQSACSSSLVAIHLACQSLLLEESDVALAGAAALSFPEKQGYFYEEGMILSADGHCRSFDQSANGTIFGNGVGTVLLKPLDQAFRDGDHIYAVIRGSAINNDGSSKVDFNAPSWEGQSKVVESALNLARIEPETIGYIEAHGTGTAVGDPIELSALTGAFQKRTKKKQFCGIGSVKTNIGHLDAASGMAGFIKAALCLKYAEIPATLHYETPNEQIDFENSSFYVVNKNTHWEKKAFPRRCGVTSLGIGGTNAHLVLEELHQSLMVTSEGSGNSKELPFLFSAESDGQLFEYIRKFKEWLESLDEENTALKDISYTLIFGRKTFSKRFAIFAKSHDELLSRLDEALRGKEMGLTAPLQQSCTKENRKRVEAWLSNQNTDWSSLFDLGSCLKVSLPGYPFAKTKYWYDQVVEKQRVSQTESAVDPPAEGWESYFLQFFAKALSLPEDEIALEDEIQTFNIDSILAVSLYNKFEKEFGPLSKTLFFEHRTLKEIALHVLKKYPEKFASSKKPNEMQVAIVGLSGRYPGSNTMEEFWDNLLKGSDLVTEIPKDRWDHEEIFSEQIGEKGKTYSKKGGFIDDFDKFDAAFFKIAPIEAEIMDPQERLFLQSAWEAVEDAGYTTEELGKICDHQIGVYVGATYVEYQLYAIEERAKGHPSVLNGIISSIANRVSYLFDFRGPSFSVDTMCSSSLTALELACTDIIRGKTKAALIGGVNMTAHPNKYFQLAHDRMLSKKGVCQSFGEGDGGYVPSEGVGCVLLKPLDEAIKNGDHIYGVIRGVETNHGGRTTSFTAPNAQAQCELISNALASSGVDASEISYVEAHSTGTKLGDPIEIQGLTNAYFKDTDQKQYCKIGSLKSNIGHAESAAGIAGLTKILLQLKHQILVPSIHSEPLNSAIKFEETPFSVVQAVEKWEPAKEGGARIAGLSAFGAGGSNAHVIIEEYQREKKASTEEGPGLFVLSAKDPGRLKEYAEKILHYSESLVSQNAALSEILYTLQVGREAMSHRLAFICSSIEEMKQKLDSFLSDRSAEGIFLSDGKERKNREKVESGDLQTLALYFVNYGKIDWEVLYEKGNPSRISLPTYPFDKVRFFIKQEKAKESRIALHPLVHENISDSAEVKFHSALSSLDSVIKDHCVGKNPLLPGAAYIEMAAFAAGKAQVTPVVKIGSVRWLKPFFFDEETKPLYTSVIGNGFEIWSGDADPEKRTLYCQGSFETESIKEERKILDLSLLSVDAKRVVTKEECYKKFAQLDFQYGPAYQTIQRAYLKDKEAIAEVVLPRGLNLEEYLLHPVLLDAAFQGTMLFDLEETDESSKTYVPFGAESIQFFKKATEKIYVQIGRPVKNHSADRTYQIDLFDEEGELFCSVQDFTEKPLLARASAQSQERGTLFSSMEWKEKPVNEVDFDTEGKKILITYGEILEAFDEDASDLISIRQGGDLEIIFSEFLKIFSLIKNQMKTHKKASYLLVIDENDLLFFSPFLGFFKTLMLEKSSFVAKILVIPHLKEHALRRSLSVLIRKEWATKDPIVRYSEELNLRETQQLVVQSLAKENSTPPVVKENGVYWCLGGTGGLGKLFATFCRNQNKPATLVLSGRSKQNEAIKDLEGGLLEIAYIPCDVSDRKSTKDAAQMIVERFGRLDGVIHAAGVNHDSLIVNKSEEQIRMVFLPKVHGLMNIEEAIKDLSLDYFVLFSSDSSILGNVGQADYSAANAFLDAFASTKKGQRAKVINWPYWKEGGMSLDESAQKMIFNELGILPLETEEGWHAFEAILKSGHSQVMVSHGDLLAMKAKLFAAKKAEPNKAFVEDPKVLIKIETYLKKVLVEELRLSESQIEKDSSFEDFGLDSILSMHVISALEKDLGSLPKTLFFEYLTFGELCAFFSESYGDKFSGDAPKKENKSENLPPLPQKVQSLRLNTPKVTISQSISDIAIIGISGKYPQADNLDELWENLKVGKNCIEEIPSERWDGDFVHSEGNCSGRRGGFIRDLDKFDPLFFKMSMVEAQRLDPQEKLFLESSWHAIEDAGYTRARLREKAEGAVGVYVGSMYQEYQLFNADQPLPLNGVPASIANRVSYFFNLSGPSITIDTMCSSSLTAIYLACNDLASGVCKMAIAGGTNVTVHPNKYNVLAYENFLSSDGLCKSFGEGGDGYVPSEGIGAVILKPLTDAIVDGDQIYGVIKGIAINHGGKANGFTVPSPKAQSQVVKMAIEKARVAKKEVNYIETHGTGTSLGDPIEISGLSKVFPKGMSCPIGSIKSNIGHAEATAGMAALSKVLLQIKNGKIAPSIHSEPPNPNIDFDSIPFYVQKELGDWDSDGGLKTALISSFGAGGANASMVVQEYPKKPRPHQNSEKTHLFVLSASHEERLQEYALKFLEYFTKKSQPDFSEADLAYTLQVGREAMAKRLAILFIDFADLREKLRAFLDKKSSAELFVGDAKDFRNAFQSTGSHEVFSSMIDQIQERESLAEFWVKGVFVDWDRFYQTQRPQIVSLPVYPFAKERCWFEMTTSHRNGFHSRFNGTEAILSEHLVEGVKTLPGAATVEMFFDAAKKISEQKIYAIKDLIWLQPIQMAHSDLEVTMHYEWDENQAIRLEINSKEKGVLAQATIPPSQSFESVMKKMDLESVRNRCPEKLSSEEIYTRFAQMGMEFGPSFKRIRQIDFSSEEWLAHIEHREEDTINPYLLDAAFQSTIAISKESKTRLPFTVKNLTIHEKTLAPFFIHGKVNQLPSKKGDRSYTISFLSEEGEVLCLIEGFKDRPFSEERKKKKVSISDESFEEQLTEVLKLAQAKQIDVEESEALLSAFLDEGGLQ